MTRRWGRILLAALVVVGAVLFAGYRVVTDVAVRNAAAVDVAPVEEQVAVRPVANDCSGGYVVLTFDDGPRQHTDELLDRLEALDMTAVFFWAGQNIEGREELVRRAVEGGNVLGNHCVSHPDLTTGELPSGDRVIPWGPEQIRDELERTNDLLVEYGAPVPQYYRPPYGSVNPTVDAVAREVGLRLVMSYGHDETDNLIDSHDTEGISPGQIVANVVGPMRDGSIITMHDGLGQATLNSIEALQAIADVMNERNLGSTTDVRPDAGGRVLQFGE